jgi:hypothetical protein
MLRRAAQFRQTRPVFPWRAEQRAGGRAGRAAMVESMSSGGLSVVFGSDAANGGSGRRVCSRILNRSPTLGFAPSRSAGSTRADPSVGPRLTSCASWPRERRSSWCKRRTDFDDAIWMGFAGSCGQST